MELGISQQQVVSASREAREGRQEDSGLAEVAAEDLQATATSRKTQTFRKKALIFQGVWPKFSRSLFLFMIV